MSNTSLAHSSTVPNEVRERVLRGLRLFRERGEVIERAPEPATFFVPGCGDGRYTVSLGVGEDKPSCNCPDFERRQAPCKHVYALQFWTSRRNVRKPATPRNRTPVAEFAA